MLPSQFARIFTKQAPYAINCIRALSDKQVYSFTVKVLTSFPTNKNPTSMDHYDLAKEVSKNIISIIDHEFIGATTKVTTTQEFSGVVPDNDE